MLSRNFPLTLGVALVLAPLAAVALPSGKLLPLANGSFEKGFDEWKRATNGSEMITLIASGQQGKGIQINDDDAKQNARLTSGKLDVTAGKSYEVSFYARTISGAKGIGAFLVFFGADGERLEQDPDSNQHKDVGAYQEWTELKLDAKAPAGATKLAVEVRSNKTAIIKSEVDEFRVYELP